MKLNLDKLSVKRKITLTVSGVLYALAILGNAAYGSFITILSVTIFFIAITAVLLLWIK